jgi:hypothetical protein
MLLLLFSCPLLPRFLSSRMRDTFNFGERCTAVWNMKERKGGDREKNKNKKRPADPLCLYHYARSFQLLLLFMFKLLWCISALLIFSSSSLLSPASSLSGLCHTIMLFFFSSPPCVRVCVCLCLFVCEEAVWVSSNPALTAALLFSLLLFSVCFVCSCDTYLLLITTSVLVCLLR